MPLRFGTAMGYLRPLPRSRRTRSSVRFPLCRSCSAGISGRWRRYGTSWRAPTRSRPCSAASGRVSCCGWSEGFRQRSSRTTSARAFASVTCSWTSTGDQEMEAMPDRTFCRAVSERSVKEIEIEALLAAPEGFGDDVPVNLDLHARTRRRFDLGRRDQKDVDRAPSGWQLAVQPARGLSSVGLAGFASRRRSDRWSSRTPGCSATTPCTCIWSSGSPSDCSRGSAPRASSTTTCPAPASRRRRTRFSGSLGRLKAG